MVENGRGLGAFRLVPSYSERVWGRRDLRPWFQKFDLEDAIGEAWLTGPDARVDSGPAAGERLATLVQSRPAEVLGPQSAEQEFPLLVKLLFPNDKLSVQVHPNDQQAQEMGQARGKTECWYVLEAEPGAAVALGMKPGVTREAVQQSVADGTLESLMHMEPVSVGDMVFVDAGTVHAIGPGVVLLETQQTSDITYRMFDYGRPRELHLEQGLRVMRSETRAGKVAPRAAGDHVRLIEEQYFSVDRYDIASGGTAVLPADTPGCLVALRGAGRVERADEPELPIRSIAAAVLPVGPAFRVIAGDEGLSLVHCISPRA